MNDGIESETPLHQSRAIGSAVRIQKPYPVWSGWDILWLFFFTGFSLLFIAALGDAVSHLVQVKFPSLKLLRHPASQGMFLLLFQAALDGLILLFIYFTITLKYNSSFFPSIKWVRWHPRLVSTYLPLGALLAFAVLGLSALFPSPASPPIEELLRFPITALLFAILGVFVAPLVEEVIFRGFIYPVIERRLGKMLAVTVTALLFTGLHVSQLWGSWTAIMLILGVGATLSVVRARTDSLIPSFIIHLSYNSTICLLFFISFVVKGFPV